MIAHDARFILVTAPRLAGSGTGLVDTAALVGLPTTPFIVAYLGATLSAARILSGRAPMPAVLSDTERWPSWPRGGWMLLIGLVVAVLGAFARPPVRPAVTRSAGVSSAP